jgi:hypothetical protein
MVWLCQSSPAGLDREVVWRILDETAGEREALGY